MKIAAIVGLAGLVFMAVVLVVLRGQEHGQKPASQGKPAVPQIISGKLDIRSPDDIRVNGKKIILCGVVYAKPAAMRELVADAMRRPFQGRSVVCHTVGAGTPCDGRTAAAFNGRPVVQCVDGDVDIAREMSNLGLLCDRTSQSGGAYKAC